MRNEFLISILGNLPDITVGDNEQGLLIPGH